LGDVAGILIYSDVNAIEQVEKQIPLPIKINGHSLSDIDLPAAGKIWRVNSFVVHPGARHQAVGHTLLSWFLRYAREGKVDLAYLTLRGPETKGGFLDFLKRQDFACHENTSKPGRVYVRRIKPADANRHLIGFDSLLQRLLRESALSGAIRARA
jgi:GNAT superfamily N-acetyltransferase